MKIDFDEGLRNYFKRRTQKDDPIGRIRVRPTLSNDEKITVDSRSLEPVKDQIRRQIRDFTKNKNVGRTDIVSMDQFTEYEKIN